MEPRPGGNGGTGMAPPLARFGVAGRPTGGRCPCAIRGGSVTRQESLSRISIAPDICFGKPCIRGRRIRVSLILDAYPGLAQDDVLACIAYGAEVAAQRYIEIPLGSGD